MKIGKREQNKRARQSAVLEAARLLIERSGVDAVTMQALAQSIGGSVGGLYRYFPNKEAIFSALQIDALMAFRAHLNGQDEIREHGSRKASLRRVANHFDAWRTFREVSPNDFFLLDAFVSFPHRALDSSGSEAVEAQLDAILAVIVDDLSEAVRLGALDAGDARLRTHMIWASMHGVEQLRKRDTTASGNYGSVALRRQLKWDLLTGWGAPKGLLAVVMADAEEMQGT
ncbi:MAG: TetR/AcrR family transcriptional regulator [Bradymonadia bacterium]